MRIPTTFLLGPCLLLVSASSRAASHGTSVVGTWKGRIKFAADALKKIPQDRVALAKKMMPLMSQARIILVLSKDKTYTFAMNTPQAAGAPKSFKDSGKWALEGNQLTLTPRHQGASGQILKSSKDGKSFSLPAPDGTGAIVFTR